MTRSPRKPVEHYVGRKMDKGGFGNVAGTCITCPHVMIGGCVRSHSGILSGHAMRAYLRRKPVARAYPRRSHPGACVGPEIPETCDSRLQVPC